MTVTYRNRLSDLWAFNVYHLPRRRTFLILQGFVILIFSFTILPSILQNSESMLLDLVYFAGLLGVLLLAPFLLTVGASVLAYDPRLNRGILTDHTITLDESGVTEETKTNRSNTLWEGVLEVRQNRRHIFIYVSEHAAHVVPKRAFAGRSDAEEFFRFAKDRLANRSMP